VRSLLFPVSTLGRLSLTTLVTFAVVLTSGTVPTGVAQAAPAAQTSFQPETALNAPALAAVLEEPDAPLRGIDLDGSNRAAQVPGLYDWSKAGFRGGSPLPSERDISSNASCRITPSVLSSVFGVTANDGADDTTGIQNAIDQIKASCSPTASYTSLSLIELPAGTLNVSREISVDVIRPGFRS